MKATETTVNSLEIFLMSCYTHQNARMGGTLVVTAVAAGYKQTNKQTNPQDKKTTTTNEISLKYQ